MFSLPKPAFILKIVFILILLALFTLITLSWVYLLLNKTSPLNEISQANILTLKSDTPQFIPNSEISVLLSDTRSQQQIKISQLEFDAKVAKVEALFKRYGSPMQGYGALIINRATECGGDYRVIVGIAGNESGLGRVPYKLYNPFGYIDGRQYSGWEESLSFLSCVISQRFLAPCNNDLTCIIRTYGGPDTPREQWIRNVTYFINQQ